jgi:excisionase family DNA binding protein
MPPSSADLLTLSDAAAILGVHPATLRRWADQGDVLVMVTPGGHRRFPRSEIERLKGIESHAEDEALVANHHVSRALSRTREHLPEQAGAGWVAGFDAAERSEKRASGLRLMALLQESLASDEARQPVLLEEVRSIGRAYAADAQRHGLSLTDVLGAITFFRDQTTESTLAGPDASDPRVARGAIQRINAFFNAVLLAVAAVFD